MGQSQSSDTIFPKVLEDFFRQENVLQRTRFLTKISSLTYEEFLQHLAQLNALSQRCIDADGKQLMFAVKRGSDATLLWKGTVKIACVKFDPGTKEVESCKLLSLSQFLKVYRALQNQLSTVEQMESSSSSSSSPVMSASSVFREVNDALVNNGCDTLPCEPDSKLIECCICLERKPDVMLPCAHCYCHFCIEQWKVNNLTCPICRETIANKDESWVISEAPNSLEISEQIFTSLLKIAESPDLS